MDSLARTEQSIETVRDLPSYFELLRKSTTQEPTVGFKVGDAIHTYTPRQILEVSDAAYPYYLKELGRAEERWKDDEEAPVIGILAYANIQWAATFLALSRLGYVVLSITHTLPKASREQLLVKTKCQALVWGSPLSQPDDGKIQAIPIIPLDQLKGDSALTEDQRADMTRLPKRIPSIAVIIHSSGSTGVPKTFPLIQTALMSRITSPDRDLGNTRKEFITSALYNSAGISLFLCALVKSASPMYYWDDTQPYTASELGKFLHTIRPDWTALYPSVLALAVQTPEGIEALRNCEQINVFGAICPQEVGDRIVDLGINISSSYAMSECGTLMTAWLRPAGDKVWDYMLPLPTAKDYIWMKLIEEANTESGSHNQLFECVILPGMRNCPPSMSNSNDPPGSFYTKDLFVKHPTLQDRWKLIGRRDDQIYNSTANHRVSALDYEHAIKAAASDVVEEVVLFGHGRDKLCLLVYPKALGSDFPTKAKDTVWKAIETKVNPRMSVPIEEHMIVMVDGEVPRTDKGNFIRPRVHLMNEEKINEAYRKDLNASMSETTRKMGSL